MALSSSFIRISDPINKWQSFSLFPFTEIDSFYLITKLNPAVDKINNQF